MKHHQKLAIPSKTMNLVTIKRFADLSGYSQDAVRSKITRGEWGDGITVTAPDGRVLISVLGYEAWAESEQHPKQQSRSHSNLNASATGNDFNLSPPPLI